MLHFLLDFVVARKRFWNFPRGRSFHPFFRSLARTYIPSYSFTCLRLPWWYVDRCRNVPPAGDSTFFLVVLGAYVRHHIWIARFLPDTCIVDRNVSSRLKVPPFSFFYRTYVRCRIFMMIDYCPIHHADRVGNVPSTVFVPPRMYDTPSCSTKDDTPARMNFEAIIVQL